MINSSLAIVSGARIDLSFLDHFDLFLINRTSWIDLNLGFNLGHGFDTINLNLVIVTGDQIDLSFEINLSFFGLI